jgi:hypothetical protein
MKDKKTKNSLKLFNLLVVFLAIVVDFVRGEMEVGWGCVWKGSEVSRKAEL